MYYGCSTTDNVVEWNVCLIIDEVLDLSEMVAGTCQHCIELLKAYTDVYVFDPASRWLGVMIADVLGLIRVLTCTC